jgi:hypothetical protein
MNTLELDMLIGLGWLSFGLPVIRHWPHAPRSRTMPVIRIAFFGWMMVLYFGMALYLVIHPADIQSLTDVAPGVAIWVLYALLVPWCLFILGSLVVTLRSLLQRLPHRR